jgi:hypothetical protein
VTIQRCCNDLRDRHDAIVRALALPAYQDAATEQKKVVRHYLDRSRELARATLLVADAGLVVPTSVFMRVLCEDLFLITYAATSEENASRLAGAGVVAMAHAVAVNLQRGRAHIRKIGRQPRTTRTRSCPRSGNGQPTASTSSKSRGMWASAGFTM